jgi:DNA-binding MarR family transcriptional regulator
MSPRQRPRRVARPSSVRQEIGQTRPFRSPAQESTIALLRTASVVGRAIGRIVEPSGLSLAQYNVLRILNGAGAGGLPTLTIRDRMIEVGASITRLLDKLEAAGLVRRERTASDRRQVRCFLTAEGRRLLAKLDPAVDAADERAMAGLSARAVRDLIATLDAIRAGLGALPAPGPAPGPASDSAASA